MSGQVILRARDVGIAELRFLATIGGGRPDGLFSRVISDRDFPAAVFVAIAGVDVRGGSYTLRISYRTCISSASKRPAAAAITADVDGNSEDRPGAISVFNRPTPLVETDAAPEEEAEAVAVWIGERLIRRRGFRTRIRSSRLLPRDHGRLSGLDQPSRPAFGSRVLSTEAAVGGSPATRPVLPRSNHPWQHQDRFSCREPGVPWQPDEEAAFTVWCTVPYSELTPSPSELQAQASLRRSVD